jgi:glycosyltransferase involved in cell wall biosynthesis
MACGLPVITSELPALRESTGGNAVLLSPDDMEQWVDNIKTLLGSPHKRDELAAKGVAWAKKFTWEKKAEEYEAALIKAKNIFEKS